jgi:hypothetical protein
MLLNPEKTIFLQNVRIININKKAKTCLRVILFIIFITNSNSSPKYLLLKIMANRSGSVDLQKHEV